MKRKSIFCFLKDQNCEAYFLQETYSEPHEGNIWSSKWGGVIFFSHGTFRSKGVCILMNPSFNFTFENSHKDPNERIVSVDVNLNASKFTLCNIYVPNEQRQQEEFLHNLNTYLMYNTDIENVIVGGDWNITLQAIDKTGGTFWKPTIARDKLIMLMNEFALVDIFREQNPLKKRYTYKSKALNLCSCIDFFTQWVEQIDTLVSIAPDHRVVKLTLNPPHVKRGPGLWKFNNSLLEDEKFVKVIRENFTCISEKYSNLKDKRLRWKLIKMELRGLTIPFAKNKAKT